MPEQVLFLQNVPDRLLHAYQLPPGRRLMQALAAALDGSGPAILPLARDLPAARLRSLMEEVRPHALVTGDDAAIRTTALEGGVPVTADTALVIATSGTTGHAKGVELSADALTHSARATLDRLDVRSDDRWLACLPPDHIAGAQVLIRSLVAGTDPIYGRDEQAGFDGQAGFDVAATLRSGAEHIALVPTMLRRLVDAGADLSVFRTILLGGAAVSADLLRRAADAGGTVVTTYGMTETCGGCVYDGRPLAGVLADVAGGGRIWLGGDTLFSRYRRHPDLTAAALEDTADGLWFATNDLGRWDGGRLRVLGRADDVIVTGGYNVAPAEVADILETHPEVMDVAVVGRPDPEWGERVTAVVVPTTMHAPPTVENLREYVRRWAPAQHAPKEVDIVASIPLLGSGKPDREALRRGGNSGGKSRVDS